MVLKEMNLTMMGHAWNPNGKLSSRSGGPYTNYDKDRISTNIFFNAHRLN